MRNILIVIGHPAKESLSKSVAEKYAEGARKAGNNVKIIDLHKSKFNINLEEGYKKRQKLEKDLRDAQKNIMWANRLVFVYPIWWGTMPAKLKGFLDRVFLPGFAFKFEKKSILPKQLLKGKSARMILLKGGSRIFYFGSRVSPSRTMKRFVFHFSGVRPVRIHSFYSASIVKKERAEKILKKAFRIGLHE